MLPGTWSSAGAREDYWHTLFPFEVVWKSMVTPGGCPRLGRWIEPARKGEAPIFHRKGEYDSAAAWAKAVSMGETKSLHVVPHPARFLVIDYDLRDDKGRGGHELPCIKEHPFGARDVCARCWASHVVPMIHVLDECIQRPLALSPQAALYVYSGGGGLHVWYKLDEHTHEALVSAEMRVVLMDHWLPQAYKRMGVVGSPPPAFDRNVTVKVGAEGHSAHAIRLPFSLHDKTSRAAVPLRRRGAADLELPPHLVQGGPMSQDDFQARVKLLETWGSGC